MFDGTVPHNQGAPLAVLPLDVDADADLDLITSDGALLRNDGAGGFARESFAYSGVRGVGDLNGDGVVDLLLVPPASPAVPSWAPGLSTGFGAALALPFTGVEVATEPVDWRLQLLDADGDQDLDVVASVLSRTHDVPPRCSRMLRGGWCWARTSR